MCRPSRPIIFNGRWATLPMVSIGPSSLRKQERNDNLLENPDSNEEARNLVIDQANSAVSHRYYQSHKIRYDPKRHIGAGNLATLDGVDPGCQPNESTAYQKACNFVMMVEAVAAVWKL
jgi:hypothetical protein